MTLTGCVRTDGRLDLDGGRDAFRDAIQPLRGKRIEIVVRERKAQRSTQANRRYWALISVIAEHCGYSDPEEVHELMAFKFLRLDDDPVLGVPRRKRTPSLNTAEFAAYMAQVEMFAGSELGIHLPEAA